MSYANGPRIVTDGLVLCLDAADRNSYSGAGNIWLDLSGQGNNGILTNGPTFSSANGGSLVFDGTDDRIEVASNPEFGFNNNFAINFYFKLNSINNVYNQIGPNVDIPGGFSFYYIGPNNYYNIGINSFVLSNRINNFLIRNFIIKINQWYFITIIRNGTSLEMYINTEKLGSTVSNSTNFLPGILHIGGNSDSGTHTINGYISNICIYKNITFQTQHIIQNFNATRGRYGI